MTAGDSAPKIKMERRRRNKRAVLKGPNHGRVPHTNWQGHQIWDTLLVIFEYRGYLKNTGGLENTGGDLKKDPRFIC